MALDIVCTQSNGAVRCALNGELDLASESRVLDELGPVIDRRPEAVILDLAGLEFIDSTGLRVLLVCRERAADKGTPLLIDAVSDAVRRLLDLTETGDRFDYLEDG
jgi:anti-anti-sigma factor